ncbi:hypothetical protein [Lysinibacillus fusiformis]|uniref:hypothetical protein n=1 Tax=Lysinibacillus fusiformis TaxID=28031 RepID=UPI0021B6C152|nr:hypothetical protein [Lysinibacillus fusiformis]
MQHDKPNIFMRIIKGVIGSTLLTMGLMFIVITVDDKQFLQNVVVRIIGVSSIFIGIRLLHKQFHPYSYKKPGTPK